jgi:hypothetical protein
MPVIKTHKEETEIIQQATGARQSECSCNTCKAMCKTAVCMGTPIDIAKLILNGYSDSIEPVIYMAGMRAGIGPIQTYQLKWDDVKGQCCQLDDNNLCKLHTSGLKPVEGKIANHDITGIFKQPSHVIALLWEHPQYESLVNNIANHINFGDAFQFEEKI